MLLARAHRSLRLADCTPLLCDRPCLPHPVVDRQTLVKCLPSQVNYSPVLVHLCLHPAVVRHSVPMDSSQGLVRHSVPMDNNQALVRHSVPMDSSQALVRHSVPMDSSQTLVRHSVPMDSSQALVRHSVPMDNNQALVRHLDPLQCSHRMVVHHSAHTPMFDRLTATHRLMHHRSNCPRPTLIR